MYLGYSERSLLKLHATFVKHEVQLFVAIVFTLQAPSLMRQHVENGRFSAALKAYRRVLVIDEHCNIEILNHVKDQRAAGLLQPFKQPPGAHDLILAQVERFRGGKHEGLVAGDDGFA